MNYKPQTELERISHDVWVFSYYSAGMNATDIYNLKWKDVDLENEMFVYYRKKTLRQRRQVAKPVPLNAIHLEIIERHKGKNEFVFNFKDKYSDSVKLKDQLGKQLRKLRTKIGLSKNFSFMSARNSAFTNLSITNTPEQIMEVSGSHSKVDTLKGYIKRLNQTEKAKDLFKNL